MYYWTVPVVGSFWRRERECLGSEKEHLMGINAPVHRDLTTPDFMELVHLVAINADTEVALAATTLCLQIRNSWKRRIFPPQVMRTSKQARDGRSQTDKSTKHKQDESKQNTRERWIVSFSTGFFFFFFFKFFFFC
jgi:hypothetical protein